MANASAGGADYGYFSPPANPPPTAPPPPPPPSQFGGQWGPVPGGRPNVETMAGIEADLLRAGSARATYEPGPRQFHQRPVARLGFFERIEAGINLARTCFSVLTDEPQLMLVPLVMLMVCAVILAPLLMLAGGPADPQLDRMLAGIQAAAVGAVVSVVSCVGAAVMVAAATTRLQGQRPNLTASWATVRPHLPQLAGLGLLMAAERALTRALRETPWGRLVAAVVDRAWDFATLMAIPVVLFEGAGPVGSVKRSAELVRHRWSSQLVARAVLHLGVIICAIPLLVVMVVLGAWYSAIAAMVMFCVWVVLVVCVSMALNAILSAAVYRFAVTGLVSPGFREADMWRAFGVG